jgi:hypothetical protein
MKNNGKLLNKTQEIKHCLNLVKKFVNVLEKIFNEKK